MGLTRIFACAVVGTLIPTAVVLYFIMAPANTASAEAHACQVAQGFVSQSLGAEKKLHFLACGDNKEIKLKDGEWQVLGDVEIGGDAGAMAHESYVVRLRLGDDGAAKLEALTLR